MIKANNRLLYNCLLYIPIYLYNSKNGTFSTWKAKIFNEFDVTHLPHIIVYYYIYSYPCQPFFHFHNNDNNNNIGQYLLNRLLYKYLFECLYILRVRVYRRNGMLYLYLRYIECCVKWDIEQSIHNDIIKFAVGCWPL